MKFNDLEFKHTGCCGTHTWAVATHQNGVRTEVYDSEGDAIGPYRVTTWVNQTLLIGPQELPDQDAVDTRLASDALIEP